MPSDPKYSIKTSTLTGIADAIRAKTGGGSPIDAEDMATEIGTISVVDVEALPVTANGTYTAPSGKAYSPVTVAVASYETELKGMIDHSLTSIVIPEGVVDIALHAFQYFSSLQSVVFASTVKTVGGAAFEGCSNMTSLTLNEGLEEIKLYGFNGCTKLTELVLPSTITTIGTVGLGALTLLSKLTFLSQTPPTLSASSSIFRLPTTCVIHVPAGKLTAYTTATNYPDPNTYTYVEDAS